MAYTLVEACNRVLRTHSEGVSQHLGLGDIGSDHVSCTVEDCSGKPTILGDLGLPLQQVHDVGVDLHHRGLKIVSGRVRMTLICRCSIGPDHVRDSDHLSIEIVDLVFIGLPLSWMVKSEPAGVDQSTHVSLVTVLVDQSDVELSGSAFALFELQLMEVFHEEGVAGATFRHIGSIKVLGGLIEGSVGFTRQDIPVELF